MSKIVISGGPYTGKTSLLEALSENYPQFQYLPEPASVVVAEAQQSNEVYWTDIFNSPLDFCTRCMQQSLKSELTLRKNTLHSFQDRSLVDTIAYARRDHCEELIPEVTRLAKKAAYDVVLFCEPVGNITKRLEDTAMANETHVLLKKAYEEMGIPIVSVPSGTISSRIHFTQELLGL